MENKELKLTLMEAKEYVETLKSQMDMLLRTRSTDMAFTTGGDFGKWAIRISKTVKGDDAYISVTCKGVKDNEN